MSTSDQRSAFVALIERIDATYCKQSDPARVKAYWRVLQQYRVQDLEQALDHHIGDPDAGRFMPTPAHLMSRLPGRVKRPSADEAWSVAISSFDEEATILLNDEILAARNVAAPIWQSGDKYGARQAFVRAYERIADEAKRTGKAPHWWPSLGHDSAQREDVVRDAQTAGMIDCDTARNLLPGPKDGGPIARAFAGELPSPPEFQSVEKIGDRNVELAKKFANMIQEKIDQGERLNDEQLVAERDKLRKLVEAAKLAEQKELEERHQAAKRDLEDLANWRS